MDHNAGTQLRSSTNSDNLQNVDKLKNPTTPQNLRKLQQSKLARIHTRNWTEIKTLATPQSAHTETKILTNAILAVDKHHIYTDRKNTPHTQTTARTHKKLDKTAKHNKTTEP